MLALTVSAETAEEIMKKSHMAYYYAGEDGLAQVNMVLTDKKGKERTREFTMLRIDEEEGGNQKYYTYFKKPSDVARMTFMVHKATDGNDQRWIYVPAVDLIRPISADDKNSSFVGSDFSYEDVSGRHWSEDSHILVEESTLDEAPVFVIESTPKDTKYNGFAKKVSYIHAESYLPLKEEYYDDKGEMIRVFTAERIEDMDGITTVTLRRMENLKKGSNTTVEFADVDYNVGMTDDLFTERYLKNPPRQYVK
jgi:outer membrane lipoprotein-sorting protein